LARGFGADVWRRVALEQRLAICERPALWVQTNRTYFIAGAS
jgi:hypothetical protein